MRGTVNNRHLGVFAVLSAMALVVLDTGSINIALPLIGSALHVGPAKAVLAVSAYQTALIIGLLPSAYIADRYGYRQIIKVGLVLFGIGSAVCGLADTMLMLVIGRAVQGLGGAAIMALGIALLRLALGQGMLGKAIAWNAMTVACCSAAAPIAGAAVIAFAPWPWLFYGKLPLVLIALLAVEALPEFKPGRNEIDTLSIVMHAAIAGLILGAAQCAITHPAFAALLIIIASLIAKTLLRRQKLASAPLWPVDLVAFRPIKVSALASVLCFCGQSAGLLALPYYLLLGLGQGPIRSGLVLACWPLTVGVTSISANRIAERFGSALPCVAGCALLSISLLASALWPVSGNIAPLVFSAALGGLGFGMFQVPNNRTLFLTVPSDRSAAAGGIQGSARLIGQAIGALIVGFLLAIAPTGLAVRVAFGVASIFAGLAAVVSALELPSEKHRVADLIDA
jgi:DHA2 family multidrug resistance protein-like MFS transporter